MSIYQKNSMLRFTLQQYTMDFQFKTQVKNMLFHLIYFMIQSPEKIFV